MIWARHCRRSVENVFSYLYRMCSLTQLRMCSLPNVAEGLYRMCSLTCIECVLLPV